MSGIDLKLEYKNCYKASSKTPVLLEVPEFNCLIVDGEGRPEEAGFEKAASTLYPIVYTLKYSFKAEKPEKDFVVMPMEVIWRLDRSIKRFEWSMLLVLPDFVTRADFLTTLEQVRRKFNPPLLDLTRLERRREGLCVQMQHPGPYDGMNDTLGKMRLFASEKGLKIAPDTHDIYLNSILRTKPQNLRTIMRAIVLN
ncbi:MAG: hypothetical protein LWX83_06235 [Anaerolineae bacterium]|nr:hypothetical protein [Anaerolineae bacterium]